MLGLDRIRFSDQFKVIEIRFCIHVALAIPQHRNEIVQSISGTVNMLSLSRVGPGRSIISAYNCRPATCPSSDTHHGVEQHLISTRSSRDSGRRRRSTSLTFTAGTTMLPRPATPAKHRRTSRRGLVLGRFRLHDRLAFTVGGGIRNRCDIVSSTNHIPILSIRFPF